MTVRVLLFIECARIFNKILQRVNEVITKTVKTHSSLDDS